MTIPGPSITPRRVWTTIFTDDTAVSGSTLVTWDISFFENQSNLTIDDFTLDTTGSVAVSNLQISQDNGTSVQVTANLTGDGTAQLKFDANTDLVDDQGNGNGTNGYTAAYDECDEFRCKRRYDLAIADVLHPSDAF